MPAVASSSPEAAMRAVLSTRSTKAGRTASLKQLCESDASSLPPAFLASLLRRPHLLTTSYAADRAASLLRASPSPARALAGAPSRPAGPAAVRAVVIVAAAAYAADPAAAQPVLLAALAHAGPKLWTLAARAARDLPADAVAPLLERAETAVASAKPAAAAPPLALVAALRPAAGDFAKLLTLVTRAAIAGVPVGGPALATAPPAAVADVAVPLLERALRRDRAAALRAIPALLNATSSADMSGKSVSCLWNGAVEATQATDANLRSLGCTAIAAIARRVRSDAAGALDALSVLARSFKTAKYAYQRTAAATAIVEVCTATRNVPRVAGAVFPIALEGVTSWLVSRRETGDDARAAAARCVVAVLSLLPRLQEQPTGLISPTLNARKALAGMLLDKKAGPEKRAIVCALCEEDLEISSCVGLQPGALLGSTSSPLLDALFVVAESQTTSATALSSDALRASAALLRLGVLRVVPIESRSSATKTFLTSLASPGKSSVLLAASAAAASFLWRQDLPPSVSLAVDSVDDARTLVLACEEVLSYVYCNGELPSPFSPESKNALCTALVRVAADPRQSVARTGVAAIRRIRRRCESARACLDLLDAFFRSELGDSESARMAVNRMSYCFDDRAQERERLLRVLHACVLPRIPVEAAPLALLAAHHPRTFSIVDNRLRIGPVPQSRTWAILQAALPAVSMLSLDEDSTDSQQLEEDDGMQVVYGGDEDGADRTQDDSGHAFSTGKGSQHWVKTSLKRALGPCGLAAHAIALEHGDKKGGMALTQAALWGVAGIVRCAPSDELKSTLLNYVITLLAPVAGAAPKLSTEHWDAFRSTADLSDEATGGASRDLELQAGRAKPKAAGKGKAKALQKPKDPPGSAAAVAAEKLDRSRKLASETRAAIATTSGALRVLSALCLTSAKTSQSFCAALLSLIMPATGYPELEQECRDTLLSLSLTFGSPLKSMALPISSTLYRIGAASFRKKSKPLLPPGSDVGGCGDTEVQEDVARLVHWLKGVCEPPLSAEGFALIAPIVKESMTRDPSIATAAASRTSAARAAAAGVKKEAIGVARAGTQVLCAHCKPEAIDSAVAAAGARAGTWALAVLEREDAAFGVAAETLASLARAALNPGSNLLSQVLGGVVSGKSSVRDAALSALERIPALCMSSVACPRDSILGRTLWLGMHDPEEENANIAKDLWEQYNHPLNVAEDAAAMLALLAHVEPEVRAMAARATAQCLVGEEHAKTRSVVIPQAFTLYLKRLPEAAGGLAPPPEKPRSVPRQRMDAKERADAEGETLVDDQWHARHGVALALRDMAVHGALASGDIPVVFAFLASRGLGDLRDEVRDQMSSAAMSVVSCAGPELGPKVLLPMIEKQLNAASAVEKGTSRYAVAQADRTRENLIMCLGGVAEHLPPTDPRKAMTAEQIIKTAVETPSEVVQNAAARCLIPLAESGTVGEGRAEALRNELLSKLWCDKASYGERRGAAYALAGIVRGLGIKSMKAFRIVEELEAAATEKAEHRRRQGAFIAMETLAIMLGRLYEPYTVRMLPVMLVSMGDSVTEVRNACWAAAQASMSKVSSQGVKMILPSLLSGLNERQWRTKAGAAEVLGAMAFCAPRQLSECLPQVVPKLAIALADAHPKVVAAAESAIGRIAAVARSPEVRNLSRFLLAALRDPAGRTQGALDAMLGTAFVHAIDPASLSLLIPPLHRGLRDRSTELKKRAAAIVGSMCNNVSSHHDVAPYLDLLLPDLRITLLDAIPDVRKTSARAIGALAVALGEEGLPSIVPWLVGALLSGSASGASVASSLSAHGLSLGSVAVSSSAERSGAAMGLAEVCAALPDHRIEEILSKVLEAGETSSTAREGGLMLLASLPRALGERYEDRLALALSSILRGLADDADSVREAALDAGRKTVSAYAKTSLDTLLPELLAAMKDTLWRIRYAATQLLGDFLLVIAGAVSPQEKTDTDAAGNDEELMDADDGSDGGDRGEGELEGIEKGSVDEDQVVDSPEMMAAVMSLEATMKAIEEVLGIDRRNEVLAALYIVRCDVSIRVRQIGMQVWKTVVSNTPRILREIMPCAVRQIIVSLSDEDEERRVAAGKALADLSHKLGDRVVPEVLPALRSGITDSKASSRVRLGACEGLAELVAACPKEQLVAHGGELLAAVCDALLDPSPDVRSSGAQVFATLLRPLGSDAVDKVIPMLIGKMSSTKSEGDSKDDGADRALDGMKKIMAASGTRLLSIVVPRLLAERPLTRESCRALSAAAAAAVSEFEPFVQSVVSVILDAADSDSEWSVSLDELIEPIAELLAVMADCGEEVSVQILEFVYLAFNEVSASRRVAAGTLCGAFARSCREDVVAARAVSLIEVLIRQLSDSDGDVVVSASKALTDLTQSVPCSKLTMHVGHIRQALRSTASGAQIGDPEAVVAGLNIPKGPAPFVPVFAEALLNGSPSLREQAALAIADLAEMTKSKILSPFVIKLTGPLIRVISERVPWQVKAAILRALLRLLEKAAPLLRTFAPQLQSTFLKCLADSNRLVRVRACSALGALVPVQPRVEALLKDLFSLSSNGPSSGARMFAFLACARVFKNCKKLPASAFTTMPGSLIEGLQDDDGDVAKAAARALGSLAVRSENAQQYFEIIQHVLALLESEDADYDVRSRCLFAVSCVARVGSVVASSVALEWSHVEEMSEAVTHSLRSSAPPVEIAACSAAVDLFALLEIKQLSDPSRECREEILQLLGGAIRDSSPEVRVGALDSAKRLVAKRPVVVRELGSALVSAAGSSNTGVRGAADRVLRRAFVVSGEGIVDSRVVEFAKAGLDAEDVELIDRRLPRLLDMPDSETEDDLATADD